MKLVPKSSSTSTLLARACRKALVSALCAMEKRRFRTSVVSGDSMPRCITLAGTEVTVVNVAAWDRSTSPRLEPS